MVLCYAVRSRPVTLKSTVGETSGVQENFGMSQFWYDDDTQKELANEMLSKCPDGGTIAVLSAPSVINGMVNLGKNRDGIYIFEFDDRFGETYPTQFVHYDFNEPLKFPEHLKHSVQYVMADPPYLSHSTIQAFLDTMQLLAKPAETTSSSSGEAANSANSSSHELTEQQSLACPMMFITSPRNADFLGGFGFKRTSYTLRFQSKFATPMSVFCNYQPVHARFDED